jgi:hypothetical protein
MYPAAAASSVKSWSFVRRASYMSSSFLLARLLDLLVYFSWWNIELPPGICFHKTRERERERTVTFKLEITSVVSAQSLVLFAGDHLVVY